MPLIRLEEGDLINTENVVKLTKLRGNNYKFLDINGGVHSGSTYEPEEKFWPVLPAAAGYVAIYTDDDDVRYRTVVGWRVCPGGNFAVVEGSETDENSYSAIQHPDGTIIDFDGERYGSLAGYLEEIADAA